MDLNMMMREQARNGLQAQLDKAVTEGDAAAASKIVKDMETLAVSTAPKADAFGPEEIKAEMNKLDWFGVDPVKSGRAIALGKDMNPKKFASAVAFTEALVKAIDAEFKKPPAAGEGAGDDENAGGEDDENAGGEDDDKGKEKPAAKRKTDAPGDGDLGARNGNVRRSGPWTKLGDAPADIQKDVKRAADRFLPATATKEQREKFTADALKIHYDTHQRKAGKK